ncbi:serine/arginine repetitive matrix protein 1 isoform X2 [Spodoptera litura]|uniref:Serine/arginine repetitive matrix protein 1 isoform X2 n=1 Tax=Spodoptera litura TaxID=69820 RepID=A0A9J7IZ25_SPOLT|nr:serine/arginine repetitive matrix protein 1 isoform X2 [Spodoptera litura]
MMVETILESSQDFGMSNGALPQWKRELLQRRAAARSRPAQPPPPPPPPPHDEEDEELRYGPGIVKRLQSRYLSLALRDAPRRRPSVLRRATSLEHLLDDRPPPAPAPRNNLRPPRPVSMAVAPAPLMSSTRRDSVKRARSVDALSRLDSRDEPRAPSPSPPPPLAPRPPAQPRTARPPRRPTPLLRETERPPPDVVRSTLRKFESAPTRRAPPAVRISAVLRGLEGPRTSTPEPRESSDAPLSPRTPSPLPATEAMSPVPVPVANTEDAENALLPSGSRPVSRAALDGIARAGSTVRYAFEVPRAASHLPPLAATNQVLVGRARRVGVIRPMPARATDCATDESVEDIDEKSTERTTRLVSPSPPPPAESEQTPPGRTERREPPPAALVEPIPRPPPESFRSSTPPAPSSIERSPSPETKPKQPETITPQVINGHLESEAVPENKVTTSRIGAAGIERAWSGSAEKKSPEKVTTGAGAAWARGSPAQARRGRGPPPASTSVVFNFSNRKEVPDYIENDGIILRANRRNRIKPGEPGVVVLRPDALQRSDSESDAEPDAPDGSPPSPCSVRFVNDNVLINGRSSMPTRPNRDRIAKLKLQFDDSLTRTFEYPSETSLSEEGAAEAAPSTPSAPSAPSTPQLAEPPLHAPLAANTHITSAALSRYRPHKTRGAAFTLGVTPPDTAGAAGAADMAEVRGDAEGEGDGDGEREGAGEGDARPCGADIARSWSEARTHHTDLLF